MLFLVATEDTANPWLFDTSEAFDISAAFFATAETMEPCAMGWAGAIDLLFMIASVRMRFRALLASTIPAKINKPIMAIIATVVVFIYWFGKEGLFKFFATFARSAGPLPASRSKSEIESDRETKIITVCNRGNASLQGLLILKAAGYRNVKSVNKGTMGWRDAGFEIESASQR